jgi:hypothetical protein
MAGYIVHSRDLRFSRFSAFPAINCHTQHKLRNDPEPLLLCQHCERIALGIYDATGPSAGPGAKKAGDPPFSFCRHLLACVLTPSVTLVCEMTRVKRNPAYASCSAEPVCVQKCCDATGSTGRKLPGERPMSPVHHQTQPPPAGPRRFQNRSARDYTLSASGDLHRTGS